MRVGFGSIYQTVGNFIRFKLIKFKIIIKLEHKKTSAVRARISGALAKTTEVP